MRGARSCRPDPASGPTSPLPAALRAVKKGDRVAQLVLERISTPAVEEVEDLDATVRVRRRNALHWQTIIAAASASLPLACLHSRVLPT